MSEVPKYPGVNISMLPSELISEILQGVAFVPFHPLIFQERRRSAFKDILNVSHVNTMFRGLSINDPRLWIRFPLLNFSSPDFMRTIVERSTPLPFCVSYIEDQETCPISAWTPVMENVSRLRELCVEVPESRNRGGIFAKTFLSLALPVLQRAIVKFRGNSNVRLFAPPNSPGFTAPDLKTLYLTGCHICPQSSILTQISSIGISYLGGVTEAPLSIPLTELHFWSHQFAALKHLILWNCLSDSAMDAPVLQLPVLETLAIGAPFSLAARIASCLCYPATCLRTINVFFPGIVRMEDARVAADGVALFLGQDEGFEECQMRFDKLTPTVLCVRGETKVFMRFNLYKIQVNADANLPLPAVFRFLDTDDHSNSVDVWALSLWEAVGGVLQSRTKDIRTIEVALPPSNPLGPLILPSMLPSFPEVRTLTFESSRGYVLHSAAFREVRLTKLERLVVRLTGCNWAEDFGIGIGQFLSSQVATGSPVRKISFIIPSDLGAGHTFDAPLPDGIQLVLAEIREMVPESIGMEWTEG